MMFRINNQIIQTMQFLRVNSNKLILKYKQLILMKHFYPPWYLRFQRLVYYLYTAIRIKR